MKVIDKFIPTFKHTRNNSNEGKEKVIKRMKECLDKKGIKYSDKSLTEILLPDGKTILFYYFFLEEFLNISNIGNYENNMKKKTNEVNFQSNIALPNSSVKVFKTMSPNQEVNSYNTDYKGAYFNYI